MSDQADTRPTPSFILMLQFVLSVYMVSSGWSLLTSDAIPKFEGIGQWLRFVTGVLEIAGGVGLALPRSSALAAVGLMVVMLGDTVIEMAANGNPVLPIIFIMVLGVIAFFRRDTITNLGQSDQRA